MVWDGKERRNYSTEEIVAKSVELTLSRIGFDMSNPITIQKDISHLRRSREICELIQNKAITGMIVIILVAIVGVTWTGFNVAVIDKHKLIEGIIKNGK